MWVLPVSMRGWMGGCMFRDLDDIDIIIIENNINLSYVYTI